jgi:nicotinamidase-related amidase
MRSLSRLQAGDTVLLVVDVQEKFLPVIHEFERVEKNCALLLRVAKQLQIPVIITEQYPERLGSTLPSLRSLAPEAPLISKLRFSACVASTLSALEATGRKTVLLCGIEAHVCVLQTALDLAEREYSVFAARDAISSRTPENAQIGWERMMRAGVLPTSTESATFELLQEAGTPDFKALLSWIK